MPILPGGHLGCCHLLATVGNEVVKVGVRIFPSSTTEGTGGFQLSDVGHAVHRASSDGLTPWVVRACVCQSVRGSRAVGWGPRGHHSLLPVSGLSDAQSGPGGGSQPPGVSLGLAAGKGLSGRFLGGGGSQRGPRRRGFTKWPVSWFSGAGRRHPKPQVTLPSPRALPPLRPPGSSGRETVPLVSTEATRAPASVPGRRPGGSQAEPLS